MNHNLIWVNSRARVNEVQATNEEAKHQWNDTAHYPVLFALPENCSNRFSNGHSAPRVLQLVWVCPSLCVQSSSYSLIINTLIESPMEGMGGIATRESQTDETWEGMTAGVGLWWLGRRVFCRFWSAYCVCIALCIQWTTNDAIRRNACGLPFQIDPLIPLWIWTLFTQ